MAETRAIPRGVPVNAYIARPGEDMKGMEALEEKLQMRTEQFQTEQLQPGQTPPPEQSLPEKPLPEQLRQEGKTEQKNFLEELFPFREKEFLKGVIYSEILAGPRCRRRR